MARLVRTLLSNKSTLTAWGLSFLLHAAGIVLFLALRVTTSTQIAHESAFPSISLKILPPAEKAISNSITKAPVQKMPESDTLLEENTIHRQNITETTETESSNTDSAQIPEAIAVPDTSPNTSSMNPAPEKSSATGTQSGSENISDTITTDSHTSRITWESLSTGKILPVPNYPSAARRFGYQGTVRAAIFISPNGQVLEVHIIQSSGYSILDRAVLDTIRSSWSFSTPGGKKNI